MQIQLLSDIHFEFQRDQGASFLESLDPTGVDVLVLAGDICSGDSLQYFLGEFCGMFPEVVFLLGNHEYYGSTREAVRSEAAAAVRGNKNLHWLDSSSCRIGDTQFAGGTLWFKNSPRAPKWALNDFCAIADFERWVYEENATCVKYLRSLEEPAVIVTHHLPSYRSVSPEFAGSPLNDFFVCDVEDLLQSQRHPLWLHGHTHSSTDYRVGTTRVVCNPFGYLGGNGRFNDRLLLSL